MAIEPIELEDIKRATKYLKGLLDIYADQPSTAEERRVCVARMFGADSWGKLMASMEANPIMPDQYESISVVAERARLQQAALRQVFKLDRVKAREVRIALDLTGRHAWDADSLQVWQSQRFDDRHQGRRWTDAAKEMHPVRAKCVADRLVEALAVDGAVSMDDLTMHLTRNLPSVKGVTPLDRRSIRYDNIADSIYVFEQAMNDEVVMIDGSLTDVMFPSHKADIHVFDKNQSLTLYIHFGPGRFPSPFPDRWIEGCYILLPTAKRGLYMVPVAEPDFQTAGDAVASFAQHSRMIMLEVGERHYASFDLDVIRPGSLGGRESFAQWAPYLRSVVKSAWSYVVMAEKGWAHVDTRPSPFEPAESLDFLRRNRTDTLGSLVTRSYSVHGMMLAAKLYHADIGMPLLRLREWDDEKPITHNSFPLPIIDDPFAWASAYLEMYDLRYGDWETLSLSSDILDRAIQTGMAVSEGVAELKALVSQRLGSTTNPRSRERALSRLELAERTGRKLDDREISREVDRAFATLDASSARRLVEYAGLRDDSLRNLAVGAYGHLADDDRRLLLRTGSGMNDKAWLPTVKLKRYKDVVTLGDRVRILPSQEWRSSEMFRSKIWIKISQFESSVSFNIEPLDEGRGVRIKGSSDGPESRIGAIDLHRKMSVDAGPDGIVVTYNCAISAIIPEADSQLPVESDWRHGALEFIKWDFATIAAGFEASGGVSSNATFVASFHVNDHRIESLIFDIEEGLVGSSIGKFVRAAALENASTPEIFAPSDERLEEDTVPGEPEGS